MVRRRVTACRPPEVPRSTYPGRNGDHPRTGVDVEWRMLMVMGVEFMSVVAVIMALVCMGVSTTPGPSAFMFAWAGRMLMLVPVVGLTLLGVWFDRWRTPLLIVALLMALLTGYGLDAWHEDQALGVQTTLVMVTGLREERDVETGRTAGWHVTVRMDDGRTHAWTFPTRPDMGIREGAWATIRWYPHTMVVESLSPGGPED